MSILEDLLVVHMVDAHMANVPADIPPLANAAALMATTPMGHAVNPILDPTSAFFLHPSESPSLSLISSLLTENNYYSWSRAMIVALDAKNKLGFIDGSLQEPRIGDPMKPFWDRNNKIILAWLVQALSPEIAQSVTLITKASHLWLELKLRFS